MPQILKRVLAVAVLALFGVALWPLFQGLRGDSSLEQATTEEEANNSGPQVSEGSIDDSSPFDASATPSPSTGEVSDQLFQAAYAQCASDLPGEKPQSISQLVNTLESMSSGSAPDKQWENYRFHLPSGEERRVMLVPSDEEESRGKWEIRFFSVDNEGLPIPLPLPENVSGPDDLQRLPAQGQVFDHQLAENRILNDGEELITEKHNGRLKDFQWRRGLASLVCSDSDCRCLKGQEAE